MKSNPVTLLGDQKGWYDYVCVHTSLHYVNNSRSIQHMTATATAREIILQSMLSKYRKAFDLLNTTEDEALKKRAKVRLISITHEMKSLLLA